MNVENVQGHYGSVCHQSVADERQFEGEMGPITAMALSGPCARLFLGCLLCGQQYSRYDHSKQHLKGKSLS